MQDLLTPSNTSVLVRLAASNSLLAFDYDGTLAPIVGDPHSARMRRRTALLLSVVSRAYPCMILSGRAQDDVLRLVRGTGVLAVLGNHGIEPWRRTEAFAARVRSWLPDLERELGRLAGVSIEDKVFSVALHYRHSTPRREALKRVAVAAAHLRGARVVKGNCVMNVVPQEAPHKGAALRAAQERLGFESALYVGDDEADEDVFSVADPRLVTVRVGRTARSRAAFFVRTQRRIDTLLARLAVLRLHSIRSSSQWRR